MGGQGWGWGGGGGVAQGYSAARRGSMTLTRLRSRSSRSKDLISILSVFSCSTLDILHAASICSHFMQQVQRQPAAVGMTDHLAKCTALVDLHHTKQTTAGVQFELRKHDQTVELTIFSGIVSSVNQQATSTWLEETARYAVSSCAWTRPIQATCLTHSTSQMVPISSLNSSAAWLTVRSQWTVCS